MRKYGLAAAPASFMISGAAIAAPTPTYLFTPGVYTPTAASATTIFEEFNVPAGSFATTTNAFATESATGGTAVFTGATNAVGTAVNPDGGVDNYLAVNAGTFTVDFTKGGTVTSAIQYFSFSFGSLDNYNSLTLNFAGGGSIFLSGLAILTGNPLLNTAPGATPTSYAPNISGRLNIYGNGGSALNSVVFGSSQAAFEIDGLAAATPEPATWGMLILGFGMAGAALRVRRRKASIAFA